MIVSSGLGAYDVIVGRKKRNFKAVQRAVPDSSIVSETPRQVPNFNISKHIAKPFIYTDFTPKSNVVPLKAMQEGSHVAGASLFNAPVFLVPEALRQPIPRTNTIDVSDLMAEMQDVPFDVPFDYKAGIRPGVRRVKGDAVEEPDAPFPTRVGRPAADRERYGTYKVGAKDYNILGF
jgi:hypothetical protein